MRIQLDELLVGMLTPALGGHIGYGTLQNLQQSLLYTLAGNITGDRCVFTLAGDFIDLIHIDNAPLRQLHIEVRRLQKTQENVLHIVTHIAGLGEGSGISNGEGHLQNPGQGLGKQGLAAAGGPDHKDVALLQLYILAATVKDTLIVVINRDGQSDFRRLLTHDILVQHRLDLPGSGQMVRCFYLCLCGMVVIL